MASSSITVISNAPARPVPALLMRLAVFLNYLPTMPITASYVILVR
ncbi:MAG: hypothetical protein M3X11_18480 [Acidobacteriota bacterium]|nr:hypothetical protein [Acidobacteriota bacterium]